MLTLFTIPKSFYGHINIIQRNAIQSWLQLFPQCEIILFGDDDGVAETAKEFNVLHIPEIEKNEFGTPLLDSAFELAKNRAKNQILVYINSDIVLMSDFIPAVRAVKKPLFLMGGQRWDIDIKEPINFKEVDWEKKLHNLIVKKGKLHGPLGMDYFVFPRNLQHNIPRFAVGRPGWDNWFIYQMRYLKIPVIDASGVVTVIHQNHDYAHSVYGKKKRVGGPEFQESLKLAGGFSHMLTLRDSDWILTPEGLKKPSFPGRIFSEISLFPPWRFLLAIKRRIQHS